MHEVGGSLRVANEVGTRGVWRGLQGRSLPSIIYRAGPIVVECTRCGRLARGLLSEWRASLRQRVGQ